MANVVINDTNLVNIASAIREKNGLTDTYKPSEMAAAILAIEAGGGGDIEVPTENIAASYLNWRGQYDWLFKDRTVKLYVGKYPPSNTDSLISSFDGTQLEDLSNLTLIVNSVYVEGMQGTFNTADKLKVLPNIILVAAYSSQGWNMNSTFNGCKMLRDISEDLLMKKNEDGSLVENSTNYSNISSSSYYLRVQNCFSECFSLRNYCKFADNPYLFTYEKMFYSCSSLDRITDLPVSKTPQTSNRFANTFDNCHRLEELTFATQEDGTPYTASWKSQTIDLSKYVGYANSGYASRITNYNSGCTAADEVTSENYTAHYANPNAWTQDVNCSAYNGSRAANTIASLPDTSAYLATQSGATNTIKFKNNSAVLSYRPGDGINETHMAAAIAEAATKGWTVTLV